METPCFAFKEVVLHLDRATFGLVRGSSDDLAVAFDLRLHLLGPAEQGLLAPLRQQGQ